jgi:hypothetical protein
MAKDKGSPCTRFRVRDLTKVLDEATGASESSSQFAQAAGLQDSKAELVARDLRLH